MKKKYKIPKNYLVALWGVETVFGKHKGKVDIISALATLSFDKRRSKYFSNELIILLKLTLTSCVSIRFKRILGSAFYGNFQFMPHQLKIMQLIIIEMVKLTFTLLWRMLCFSSKLFKKIGWDKILGD